MGAIFFNKDPDPMESMQPKDCSHHSAFGTPAAYCFFGAADPFAHLNNFSVSYRIARPGYNSVLTSQYSLPTLSLTSLSPSLLPSHDRSCREYLDKNIARQHLNFYSKKVLRSVSLDELTLLIVTWRNLPKSQKSAEVSHRLFLRVARWA